jgi:hypothetical protein
LVVGMVEIVGAAVRDARLAPELALPTRNTVRGHIIMAITLLLLSITIFLGQHWWASDAALYSHQIFQPLRMAPALDSGNQLKLTLLDPGWLQQRKLDDFILDHNRLMHLYTIRWPAMDLVLHPHPEPVGTEEFRIACLLCRPVPTDVVHADGFPETLTTSLSLP